MGKHLRNLFVCIGIVTAIYYAFIYGSGLIMATVMWLAAPK